jgi:hypothetical protein
MDRSAPFKLNEILNSSVELSLTSGNGSNRRVPLRSGLNWGQRPMRNPDQAYIPVSARVQRLGFFPEPGRSFTVQFDDGMKFVCARAQQNGKAIETPGNNALLGIYFRQRLSLPSGELINLSHLERHGRTSILIRAIAQYSYLADFSRIL